MKFWIPMYTFDEVIAKKNEIDRAQNPAHSFLLLRELENRRVVISKAVVKQIAPSANIDYAFCVTVTVQHSSGTIECHIYTRNWRNNEDIHNVAQLQQGDEITIIGRFSRFLKLLGPQFAVELVEANITKLK